jgi:hypothetical protein
MYLDTSVLSTLTRAGAEITTPDSDQPHVLIARIEDRSVLIYSLPTGMVVAAKGKAFKRVEEIVEFLMESAEVPR